MIKIVHISDTHLKPFNPESRDILVHSGDALNYGDFQDLLDFRAQLVNIYKNYKYIIFVPGNHDRIFESNMEYATSVLKELIPNIHVLHNQSIELDGLKFYGTADQPLFFNWAFNRTSEELERSYSNIPEDVDVLITHCPAKGIRDVINGQSVGSLELACVLPKLKKLKAHLYGHIHQSYGMTSINDIVYSNGSICGENYLPINKENVIELH